MGTRTLALIALGVTVATASYFLTRTPDHPDRAGEGRSSSAGIQRTPSGGPGELPSGGSAGSIQPPGSATPDGREHVGTDAKGAEPCRIEPLDGGPVFIGDEGPVIVIGRRAGRTYLLDVQDDGTFELPSVLRNRMARFTIRSRYLRLDDQPDPESSETLVLRPARAGCLLIKPVGTNPAIAALDLSGEEQIIRAKSITEGVAPVRRDAHVGVDGQVVLGGLPEGTAWRVELTSNKHVDALVPAPMVREGETTSIELPLDLGVRVRGTVVDGDGDPVVGAALRLRSWRYHDESWALGASVEGVAGPDGEFDLGGLRPGPVHLSASADGYRRSEIDLGELSSGAVVEGALVRLKGGESVSGVVVWPDGTPAPDVSLQLRPVGGRFRKDAEATSDGEGRFEITGLVGGQFELHGRVRKKREEFVAFAPASAGQAEVRLELGPGASCQGQVVDDRGEAVTRFSIKARALGLRAGLRSLGGRFKGADGSFELTGLAPGRWEVSATAKGFGLCQPALVDVPDGASNIRLILPRVGSLAGVLENDSGTGLADARITVGQRATTTGPDGKFALEGLRPGLQRIRVMADGFGQPISDPVILLPGESREDEVIVVSRGASVIGAVHPSVHTGSEGNMSLREDGSFKSQHAPILEDGSFRFDGVRGGRYWVSIAINGGRDVVASHRAGHMVPVDVPPTGTVEVVVGDPLDFPIRVSGVVTANGAPMPGLLMYVYAREAPGVYPYAMDRTDEEGRYGVRLGAAGAYLFSVGKGQTGQSRHFVTVTDAREQNVDFELPTHKLRGRLVRAGGDPVARERVMLLHEDARPDTIRLGDTLFSRTRSDGTFVFTGLAQGRYRLRSGHYMRADEANTLVIRGGIEVPRPAGLADLEVVLPLGAVVDATALRRGGAAYPEGRIRLQDDRGYVAVIYDQRRPDANGTQRYVGIGPGAWTAVVESPEGDEVGRATVVVDEGVDTAVTVRCEVD